MKLVIVESPTKCETIKKYLGADYMVAASYGHVRDLSTSGKGGLGVDIENDFTPSYMINKDKKKTVNELVKLAKKADEVILATDPDREGEAISWHLAKILDLDVDTNKRLEFHEITKNAILKAMSSPRTIDMNLVASQETRRIIDRIMGFKLSTLLKRKIGSLSAGRVQSVTLKLITEREKEVRAFVKEEYWTIDGTFKDSVDFKLDSYMTHEITIKNEAEADAIIASLPEEFEVREVNKKERVGESKPPFTTSTMQQKAFNKHSYSTARTSSIAQKLYESGLITYMRTDSIRLSPDFIDEALSFIKGNYGEQYLGKIKTKGGKGQIQDAHEAIRPTDLAYTPKQASKDLPKDQANIYRLIYNRALGSLMAPKIEEVTTVFIHGNGYDFKADGVVLKFDGFLKILDNDTKDKILPNFTKGEKIPANEIRKEQHFTKPTPRYTEARLVKMMEELGIGRPSTYASTIQTLFERKYISSVQGSLVPSDKGMLTVEKLTEYFKDFVDTKFTANMEKELDEVVSGSDSRNTLLTSFYQKFEPLYEYALEKMPKGEPKYTNNICPLCGKPMVERDGKYGKFEACSGYPECTYILKPEKTVEYVDKTCPKCGSPLVKRHGRKGDFIGCSSYPKCTYIEGNEENAKAEGENKQLVGRACPDCGHDLIIRKGKYGKGDFIACSNFPKCKHIEKITKEE